MNLSDIPKIYPPVKYSDLAERWPLIRAVVLQNLEDKYAQLWIDPQDYDLLDQIELFEQDTGLRQSVADVLLASVLWIEAGRQCSEILENCVPEIKSQLPYWSGIFLDFLQLRAGLPSGFSLLVYFSFRHY